MNTGLSRRNFIRGLAATVGLPALAPLESWAAKAGLGAGKTPLRLAFLYVPNGVILDRWKPNKVGAGYDLPSSLQPLAGLREHFQVISGLDHDKAKANGDGPGDHARANATFLTGCQARKTGAKDLRVGVSVDQIAAQQIGGFTRLPSLELSTDPPRRAGTCDSGYACAYQFNLSWSDPDRPVPAERNPRRVFERMFGSGNPVADAKRRAQHRSVLDFVREDMKKLEQRVGRDAGGVLDEYQTALRGVEQRIEQAEAHQSEYRPEDAPAGIPKSYAEHIRLMADLMVLAFRTDSTRVATFGLAHDGSNRRFKDLGVTEGHHSLSHHRNDPEKMAEIAKIDHFYIQQLAYFMQALKEVPEGSGTLLDQSMIVYGSGIGDGNRHNHDDLPVILAGGGGGDFQNGRHLQVKEGTPMTNLYLGLLEKMGVSAQRVGDSTGILRSV